MIKKLLAIILYAAVIAIGIIAFIQGITLKQWKETIAGVISLSYSFPTLIWNIRRDWHTNKSEGD